MFEYSRYRLTKGKKIDHGWERMKLCAEGFKYDDSHHVSKLYLLRLSILLGLESLLCPASEMSNMRDPFGQK